MQNTFPSATKVTLYQIQGKYYAKGGRDALNDPAAIRAYEGDKVYFFVPADVTSIDPATGEQV